MRYIKALFLFLFSVNIQAQYVLDWADEFNGTSLNMNDWNIEKGGGSAWNNTAIDDPRVIEVSNGSLKLKGIKNPNYNGKIEDVTSIDKNSVWTGAIDTHKKIGFKYGKMEVRARIEAAPSAWPAIWLMPVHSVYGGNPLSGEIDIVEHLNYDNFYYSTVHTEYHLTNKQDPERYGEGLFTNDDSEWVVYGMIWTDQKIDFFRNGVVYHTVNKGQGLYVNGLLRWPFDEDFYIILSQQIGGGWVDGEAAAKGLKMTDADLPLTMEIDYVRVYKLSTQTIDYDISAENITRTDNNTCGTTFDIDFDVTNLGSQTITSFDVEVYIDNQLVKSTSETVNLSNTGSTSISVTGIDATNSGSKSVKVIVSNPNGNTDEVPANDETTQTISITEGILHEFFITESSANSSLSWEIKDGSSTVVTSSGITSSVSNNEKVYSFCLPAGCYDIIVSDAYSAGSGGCSAQAWSSGSNYCVGEQVVRNANLYEAKWCGTDDPSTAGQWGQWEDLGACAPAASGSYGIREPNKTAYFEVDDQSYTSPQTTAFCTSGQGINVDFTISSLTATNCESVTFTSTSNPVGTNYDWDFGIDATPATATGSGPHDVEYSSTGKKIVSLTVDAFSATKTDILTITDAKAVPTITIELRNETFPVCLDTVATFSATTTDAGTGTIEWFVEGQSAGSGDSIQVNSINKNKVQAKVTSNAVCATSNEVESNIISIESIKCHTGMTMLNPVAFNIYPNPASDVLMVEGDDMNQIEIISPLGKVISKMELNNSKHEVNISHLANGLYFIKIYTDNGYAVKEFSKK